MQKTKLKITNHSYRIVYLVGMLFIFSSCSLFKDLQISNIQDISPTFENKTVVLNATIDVKNSNFGEG